jgi:aryl-alcohol dehydrogenase-like predicted oxidoreductase
VETDTEPKGAPLEMRRLGRTGLWVSELCLGGMTFGREADEPTSADLIERFLDAGGNFIDTADRYADGASERILGRVLAGRRDRVVLATKFRWSTGPGPNDAGASRRHIISALEASLNRLGTDWIDLYQIHAWDPSTPLEETLSALDDVVRQGKVRYLGASNFAGWQLAKALGISALRGWESFVSLQPQYSLLSRDAELDLLPLCAADGLGVVTWGPLGGGVLTGKYQSAADPPPGTRAADNYPASRLIAGRIADQRNRAVVERVLAIADRQGVLAAQVALNWVRSRPAVTSTIIGARSRPQLDALLGATDWDLGDAELAELDAVSQPYVGYPHDIQRTFVT